MKEKIENLVVKVLDTLGLEVENFVVEHPSDLKMGDYSTNVGIKTGKAQEIYTALRQSQGNFNFIDKIEIAGPGFINFYLSKEFFKNSIAEITRQDANFGKNTKMQGLRVMVEHTNANPFKDFHIGHLMPNVIGSALARILEWNGSEIKQVNYQGDVGLHVAKAVWSILKGEHENAYVLGSKAYEENLDAKKEIVDINVKIYDHSDPAINAIYTEGRTSSLAQFEKIYQRLGSKFDHYFFESETAPVGQKIVEANIGRVFEKSEGAIVFKGSHTRVFINSQGLPTYEAKDLGNAQNKFDRYPYDLSIVVTGNEINDYFKVVLEAMSLVLPELAQKTKHLSHGMLRLSTGKMSSRTGDVITAEELIEDVKQKVKDNEEVAIGAIKYMILRQAIGNDIIFDIDKSVSTEGDSGVYLQYAYARTNSLLEKADRQLNTNAPRERTHVIERLLYRFPEIVERAGKEYAPQYMTTYLTELSGSFNNFYAHEQVISDDPESTYRLAITKAFNIVMKNGLTILGIPAPERM